MSGATWSYAGLYNSDTGYSAPFGPQGAVVHAPDTEEVVAVMANGNLAQAYCQFLDAAERQRVLLD